MTEREAFRIVQPLLEGYTEGIYWDFKKGLTDEHIPAIIKDILAFSNSDYNGDSYIIVGVGESKDETQRKIPLSTELFLLIAIGTNSHIGWLINIHSSSFSVNFALNCFIFPKSSALNPHKSHFPGK